MTPGMQSLFRKRSRTTVLVARLRVLKLRPISSRHSNRADLTLILADYTLPTFDGLSALRIARQRWPHVPLIFVSGTLDEEVAIEALKIGATDYVFKTRLSRIVPSVQRALREAEETDRPQPRRGSLAAKRGLFGRGAEIEPHGQLRLGCFQREKFTGRRKPFASLNTNRPTEPTIGTSTRHELIRKTERKSDKQSTAFRMRGRILILSIGC